MEKNDTKWIVAFLVLGAVGLWAFLNHYDQAIPVASLDFKISRDEAFSEAQSYAASRGHDLSVFENAQIFAPDMMSQIFLQKSVGLKETNRLAREWVSIYKWQIRWYQPLEKEEVHVHLDPGGRVVYYDHRILDEDAGASLTESDAQAIAESFAFETQDFSRDTWEEVERSSEEHTARTDHTFTYRKTDFAVGDDGHYRMTVTVQGDRVGGFREFLHVPETFKRAFEKTRSQAGLLTSVFMVCWVALGIAALVILAQRYRAGGLQWRSSTILGMAVLAVVLLAQINSLPLLKYNYSTIMSMTSFYVMIILVLTLASVFSDAVVTLSGTAGAWITRDVFGLGRFYSRLSLKNLVTGQYVRSTLIGYGLAGTMLGFLILFYYLGTELFGVWSPAYVIEYDNAFSTTFPWAYPLLVGLSAAAQEEFFFRLLAVSLMLRWLKIRWLAVLIPALVWGFLHSSYPVEPIYTRGIELTIVGIGFGYVFLRWGIWTTIVAHYAYNAFVSSFPMLRSSSLYFQTSGIVVIGLLCIPVLIAFGSALRRRGVAETEDEEDPEQANPLPPAATERSVSDVPTSVSVSANTYVLTATQRLVAAAAFVSSLALIQILDTPRLGKETLVVSIDHREVITRANAVLDDLGWELEGRYEYANYWDALGVDELAYLTQRVGVARADSLVTAYLTPRRWKYRAFMPLDKTELRVALEPTGKLASFQRVLPDNLPGAELSSEEAQGIAVSALSRHFNLDVTDTTLFKRIEASSDKREHRLDHSFVWERFTERVGEGEFRVRAGVQGDSIGSASFGFKAPETFLREFRENGVKEAVVGVVGILCVVALVVFGTTYFFRYYRDGSIVWRGAIVIGVLVAISQVIGQINGIPTFFLGFKTSQSMATFLGLKAVGFVTMLAIVPGLVAALAALAVALQKDLVPDHADLLTWFGRFRRGEGYGPLLLDSCLGAAALVMVPRAVAAVRVHVKHFHFPQYGDTNPYSLPWMHDLLPAVNGVDDVLSGLAGFLGTVAAVLIVKRVVKEWKWVFTIFIGVGCIQQIGMSKDLTHGFVIVGITVVQGLLTAGIIRYVTRFNLLAYFISSVFEPNVSHGLLTMDAEILWYQANGAVVVLIGLLPVLVGVYTALRSREA